MPLVNNTYSIARRGLDYFMEHYVRRYPGRFAALTMADFAQWGDPVLLKDDDFAKRCIEHLEADVAAGACGLKVTKELGLFYRDRTGAMLRVDDERLAPIWERAGELGVPVLIHVSDPIAFFQPIDEHNEHYLTLQEFPGWSFHGSHFTKWELLEQRNRMIARHPRTTFLLPHVANLPENLAAVGQLLDAHPNVVIDFSARIDELGRQPYTARDFFLRYQDRILFGLDMPVSAGGVSLLFPPSRNARRVFRLSRLHRPIRRLHALEALRAGPSRRGAEEGLRRERAAHHSRAYEPIEPLPSPFGVPYPLGLSHAARRIAGSPADGERGQFDGRGFGIAGPREDLKTLGAQAQYC